jgi:hypothetical protein
MKRRIFGPEREAGVKELRDEELQNVLPSPSVIDMMKSIRMRWMEHVGTCSTHRRGDKQKKLVS